ncbi:uncharacterized protein LOC132204001 [Neocloeon triangulifer]|uniref:uncharacterized protein LOC132204001 n=1 Tax=Neocloeon triangulifer TaxID=2078957 RepID=UPI00286F1441|nr:uncharacterized protein LOC132204001 [Neocloeon triangulifer]
MLAQKFFFVTILATLVASTLSHPFGVHYDEDYVDEDEPMDPPSPYNRPTPNGFSKKSSPAPPVLSYPTAFEGAQSAKLTPPALLQNQKFKIPEPKAEVRPIYVPPPSSKPPTKKVELVQDELPYAPTVNVTPKKNKNAPNFVTPLPPATPKKSVQVIRPTTFRPPIKHKSKPAQKRPAVPAKSNPNAPPPGKKIRQSSSIVSPKYAQHPSHTLASFPHFLPTVEPTYQVVPAAQQEYNIASIGGVGLLSGGPVLSGGHSDDDDGEGSYGHHQDEASGKDAKYEFMYRVQGDDKYGKEEEAEGAASDFGHSEAREGDRTWGRYFVKLPDGRLQTVRYWADHTGYHAEVVFQGEAHHPDEHPHQPSYSNHAPAYEQGPVTFGPPHSSQPAFVATNFYAAASENVEVQKPKQNSPR